MSNYKIPKEISDILTGLEEAGFEAYLAGGCVRDLVLGGEPKDWDITTNAKPEEIQKIFPDSFYENDFGTVGVKTRSENETLKIVEVTPYRIEAKYTDKRHPDEVKFSDKLEDDLKRRDFTVNAMALNLKGDLVDLFGGQEDLNEKIIRTVGKPDNRFGEDALRIMRAIRFSAELGFEIDPDTEKAIGELASSLENISQERIRDEFVKIIMAQNSADGIKQMKKTGVLTYVVPELEEGIGVTQNKSHVFTVWDHSLRALEHATEKDFPFEVRLASLFHDIGKPRTKRGEGVDSTFYGHEVVGAKMTAKIMARLRFSKKITEKVVLLVRWHLFFSDIETITLSAVRRIVKNVKPENVWDLMKVRFCDRIGMGRPKEEPYRLRKYESMIEEAMRAPLTVGSLKIDGQQLMEVAGLEPCPKVGFILHALLEEVLDDPELNTKEYLEKRAKEMVKLSDEELEKLGKEGKKRKEKEEAKEVEKIRKRYHVR